MGLEAIAAFGIHSASVFGGAKATGVRRIGILKSMAAALLSYLAMILVAPLLIPLKMIPFVGNIFGALVLALGTAVAAKVVLNCKWKQAQVIGLIAMIVNLVFVFTIGAWF